MEAEIAKKNAEKNYIDKEFLENYKNKSPEIVIKKIKKLEKKMYDYASNLEFEDAARVRDEIKNIKTFVFGVEDIDKVI